MAHPCSVALWPMVTSEPTDSGTPGSACKTQPSCTLLRSPTEMVSRSARSTAPYQTLASAPIVTRPMSTAPGATKAASETSGRSWPSASGGGRPVPGRCAGWLLRGWPGRSRAALSRPRKMPSRNGCRAPRICPPLVTGLPTTIRCASLSLAASTIAMPVLTWPKHGSAAISRPSASSFRSQATWASKAARSVPLMVAMKSSRGGRMKKTHSFRLRSCHFCGCWGCHGAGCEKATEHIASLSAAKVGWVPGVGEPLGGMGQNPCKGRKPEATASPRRCPERPFARAAGLSLVGVDVSTIRRVRARAATGGSIRLRVQGQTRMCGESAPRAAATAGLAAVVGPRSWWSSPRLQTLGGPAVPHGSRFAGRTWPCFRHEHAAGRCGLSAGRACLARVEGFGRCYATPGLPDVPSAESLQTG